MTNKERICKLCETVIDLIDELQHHDKDLNIRLEWTRDEVTLIKEDIEKEDLNWMLDRLSKSMLLTNEGEG